MSTDELRVGKPEIIDQDSKVSAPSILSGLDYNAVGISKGSTGEHVTNLQSYLRQLGYIDEERTIDEGTFDDATADALEHFQRFYGLPVTGEVDRNTIEVIQKPRCGVPDVIPTKYVERVSLLRNPWPKNNLSYYFQNIDTSPDINTRERAASAFQRGFSLWHAVTPIRFSHTTRDTEANPADIVVLWGIPGCGGAACTDWSYPGPVKRAYSLFWNYPTWVVNNPEGKYDIIAFAGHEVGHALGLYWLIDGNYYSHSPNSEALMYAEIPGGRRRLNADDIAAAHRVYG